MSQKYFWTSDYHFNHTNVIQYSNRPFATVQEMNDVMSRNHNSVVGRNDMVFILGDFAFAKPGEIEAIVQQLNGQKYLIFGNHDKTIRKNKQLQSHFVKCVDYLEHTIKLSPTEKQYVVMSHYAHLTWNRKHHGAWMLHGHSHGTLTYPFEGKIMDVGVDVHNYTPISFEQIQQHMSAKNVGVPLDHHVGE